VIPRHTAEARLTSGFPRVVQGLFVAGNLRGQGT
jgi:hypothetical protein